MGEVDDMLMFDYSEICEIYKTLDITNEIFLKS